MVGITQPIRLASLRELWNGDLQSIHCKLIRMDDQEGKSVLNMVNCTLTLTSAEECC